LKREMLIIDGWKQKQCEYNSSS